MGKLNFCFWAGQGCSSSCTFAMSGQRVQPSTVEVLYGQKLSSQRRFRTACKAQVFLSWLNWKCCISSVGPKVIWVQMFTQKFYHSLTESVVSIRSSEGCVAGHEKEGLSVRLFVGEEVGRRRGEQGCFRHLLILNRACLIEGQSGVQE